MAGQDRGKFSTDIGQELIEEALRSVRKRGPEAPASGEAASASPSPSADGSVPLDVEGAPGGGPLEPSAQEPAQEPAQESAQEKELSELRAQLELSLAKGRELMAKVKDEHERVLRATADLENYRKRALKEKEEVQKYGVEKVLRDFLPVMDNLERGLEHAKGPADFDSLVQGIKMTRKLFEDALGKHGVRGFVSKGKPFDPRMHEAMQQVETAELPPNHVYQEILRGFVLNDRLVRPALVMVTKAPEKSPEKSSEVQSGQSGPAVSAVSTEGRPEGKPEAGTATATGKRPDEEGKPS